VVAGLGLAPLSQTPAPASTRNPLLRAGPFPGALPKRMRRSRHSSRIDVKVVLKVNGVRRTLEVDSRMVLLDALRETSSGILWQQR
jgi:hypothetical protein